MDTTVRYGHSAIARGAHGERITLKADGKIGASEAKGLKRVDGFVDDIFSPTITKFIRTEDASVFGGQWQTRREGGTTVADSGDSVAGIYGWGTQQVNVDKKAHRVSLDSQGTCGEHTIEAHFDPRTMKILRNTIQETYSPVDLNEALLWQAGGEA